METTLKGSLMEETSEMEKLEKSKKSHLRMIASSVARLKLKYGKSKESNNPPRDPDSKNIRMYETHYPGFCYLRNGEYRRKTASNIASSAPDAAQCSEKVKALLFTDSELDIHKTMCLHLLGTHIQNKNHIQRKDGRLCSYVKAQTIFNSPHTLQPISQKIATPSNDLFTKYDKILPRYILDVKVLQHGISTPSVKTYDFDSSSDEESKKKRKLLVPIYINNEIRMIINSVMEALEAVKSTKLNALIDLASSPEELRNMLSNEDMQDYIIDLARNPLVMKPTSYDYVMAHIMFDKIPEKGTMETVAQVLEVYDDMQLRSCLYQIRRAILQRHLELVNSNIFPRKRAAFQNNSYIVDNSFKISNPSINSSLKFAVNPSTAVLKQDTQEDLRVLKKENGKPVPVFTTFLSEKENENAPNKKRKSSLKGDSRSVNINLEKCSMDGRDYSLDKSEMSVFDETSYTQTRTNSVDSSKCDFDNLSNSQRILLGLKVASLKCKPINMHQFEGKKKVDLSAIITPIIRPQITDIDYKQNSPENHLRNFSLPEKKVKNSTSKISNIETAHLENLTRALLANLRLEISETENKKRVHNFMATI